MGISDCSSDLCSSDLQCQILGRGAPARAARESGAVRRQGMPPLRRLFGRRAVDHGGSEPRRRRRGTRVDRAQHRAAARTGAESLRYPVAELSVPLFRSEEHTSELQSLMRISYAVFCLKKKKNTTHNK